MLALEQVGRGARVDRVHVFERADEIGDTRCSLRLHWATEEFATITMNSADEELPLQVLAPSWVHAFDRDAPVYGTTSTMLEPLRERLDAWSVRSFCACPITARRRWLGFVAFDDCHGERLWAPDEIRALQRLSNALTGALQRSRTEVRLDDARKRLAEAATSLSSPAQAVFNASPDGRRRQR